MRWAAPAGTLTPSLHNKKGKIEKTNCQGLTGRSISELEPEPELDQPGQVHAPAHNPELWIAERRVRVVKLHAIEQIEKLRSELKCNPFIDGNGLVRIVKS